MLNTENGRLSLLGLFPVPDGIPFDRNDTQQMIMYREPLAVLIGGGQASSVVSGSGTVQTSYSIDKHVSTFISGSGNVTIQLTVDKQVQSIVSGSGTVQATITKDVEHFNQVSGSGAVQTLVDIQKLASSSVSGSGSILVDIKKDIALVQNVSGSGNVVQSIQIDKLSGSVIVTGSGTVTTLYIRDFADTNIIYINLDSIANALYQEVFSTSEQINKEFTVYANTLPR